MASMSTTEVIGFCDNLIQFMQDNQAALQAAGVSVSGWLTELNAQKAAAVAKNAEQERLKADLKLKTAETKAALDGVYQNASSKLDAMVGTLGKGTPLAKQAARLRSSVIAAKRTAKKSA
jgi:hypothetical protein